jgi:spore coat polysaccharide biosynthesis protein SpsF
MMKNAFIITARTASSRLPSKIIKKIYKNIRTIDILIYRASKLKIPVILATTRYKEDDFLCNYVKKKYKIIVYRGSVNKIKRWRDCFLKYKIKRACFIEGDDPLFNYNLYQDELEKINKYDIVTYPHNIITGIFFYIITNVGISKLYNYIKKNSHNDTEIIDPFIKKTKIKKKIIYIEKIFKNKKIRLTLDYIEDYILIKKLVSRLGYKIENKKIIKFLIKNKKLSSINFFRENDYKKNQREIIKKWNV